MLPPFSAFSSLFVCVVLSVNAALQARPLTNYVVRRKGQVLGTVDGDAVGAILFTAVCGGRLVFATEERRAGAGTDGKLVPINSPAPDGCASSGG